MLDRLPIALVVLTPDLLLFWADPLCKGKTPLCLMFKTHYHTPGTAPATLTHTVNDPDAGPTVFHLMSFDETTIDEKSAGELQQILDGFQPGRVNWINVNGIQDVDALRALAAHFGLHPLAMEDVLNTTQRPKVEKYDDHLFIVMQMVYADEESNIVSEQVSLFLGKDFVLTIQEEESCDVFNPVRDRIRQARGFARKSGSDYLAYALIDAVVDHFFPVLESIGEGIEEVEEELLDVPTRETIKKLYELKRALLQIRRAAWPSRELVSFLSRNDSTLISQSTVVFLRDCYDHSVQIIELIESYREMAAGMMDIYLSSVSMRTNEVMRVLTVISSIFIPLTFIAGVYGMNFNTEISHWNMPELEWPFGYVLCIGVMLLIAIGQLIFFRIRKWI